MATITLFAVLSLFLHGLASSEVLYAKEIRQPLIRREDTYGGWALASPSCPAGTKTCEVDGKKVPSCCPPEYECGYDWVGGKHYCCTPGKPPVLFPLSRYCLLLCMRSVGRNINDPRINRYDRIGTNCQKALEDIPVCANTGWSLFDGKYLDLYFCCLSGQVGILGDLGGSCGDAGRQYPSSKLASLVGLPCSQVFVKRNVGADSLGAT